MAFEGIHFFSPPSSIFTFPPSNEPITLPAPAAGATIASPRFTIPEDIYNQALDVRLPLTIAATYALTVLLLNRYNKLNGNKPWPISKTKLFFWLVVAHNVFLAAYSAWTFVGIFGALRDTIVGWNGPDGVVGTVDSLCKIHGPQGLGHAITYSSTLEAWTSTSPNVALDAMGVPDSVDLGRLWNRGLAFYGWFFYLSKFYEVIDTVIILAKGKNVQTLQTYHHAGAMMCMWAGIRYMSPPIWMFVCVNSAVHAVMYTYYTITAFSIPVPNSIKRCITTMQIIQFLVGVSFASLHSFVYYTITVLVPNTLKETVTSIAEAATAAAGSAATLASPAEIGTMSKQALFRAAGEEALAKSTYTLKQLMAYHGLPAAAKYHTETQTVFCLDTSGQNFAIWLNVFYLTPLTFLFGRFFYNSYIRRAAKGNRKAKAVGASNDVAKGMERKILGNLPNGLSNGQAKTNGVTSGNGKRKA